MPSFLDGLLQGSGYGDPTSELGQPGDYHPPFLWSPASPYSPYYGYGQMPQGWTPQDASTWATVINQQQAEADRQYGLSKQQLDQNYKIALMNARSQQDVARANAEYQQGQLDLARQRLAFDQQTQQQSFGLQQANLGYNVLNFANNLRGSKNYFQASNLMHGIAAAPGTSVFLNALQQNARLPGFVAPAGSPDAYTAQSLLSDLGYGGAGQGAVRPGASAPGGNVIDGTVLSASSAPAPSTNDPNANLLAQIHAIGAAGAHKLGAGSLEQLSPDELGLLQSGLEAPDAQGKAFNWSDFVDQYNKSRIGQSLTGSIYRAA